MLEFSLSGLCHSVLCLLDRFCLGRIQARGAEVCGLTSIFHCCFFMYGQVLPDSELLGKTLVVSLKLHCSLVVKGVGVEAH